MSETRLVSGDPYHSVKVEIEQALVHAQHLYARYVEEWLVTELRNSLRSIDWDIQDLSETCTLQAVTGPKKDKKGPTPTISPDEIEARFRYIHSAHTQVQEIRVRMAASDARFKNRDTLFGSDAPSHDGGQASYKYSRLNNAEAGNEDDFVGNTLSQQQLIMRDQDDSLERIGDSVGVLKNMSARIGDELDEHTVMLDDLGRDMDRTESKLDNVLKKVAKVTHMSDDNRQCYAILVLSGILAILFVLWLVL